MFNQKRNGDKSMSITYMTPDTLPVLPPKVLVFGKTGTGKSTLSMRLLLGLREMMELTKRPIFLMDTEERAQALVANVLKPAGVPNKLIKIAQTRSIYDAEQVIKDASKEGGFVLIDQATHLVADLRNAYKKQKGRERLTMYDYGFLKPLFRKHFVDPYLYADVPVFLVARGKNDLRDEIDEDETQDTGSIKTKLVNHGVDAQLDGDTAYEAYLNILVEMVPNPFFKAGARKEKSKAKHAINATVIKDNYGAVHARQFMDPQFQHFLPHFQAMDIAPGVTLKAARAPKETTSDQVQKIFEENGAGKEYFEKKQLLETITADLAMIFPKSNKLNKGLLGEVMQYISGTKSWSAWQGADIKVVEVYARYTNNLAQVAKSGVKGFDTWPGLKEHLETVKGLIQAQDESQTSFEANLVQTDDDLPLFGEAPVKEPET